MSEQETCPQCGSGNVMKIVYGLPDGDLLDNPAPDVLLGGCVITPSSMTKQCGDCEASWAPIAIHT